MKKTVFCACLCLVLAGCSNATTTPPANVVQETAREVTLYKDLVQLADDLDKAHSSVKINDISTDGEWFGVSIEKIDATYRNKYRTDFAEVMESLGCTASRTEIETLYDDNIKTENTIDDFHGIHQIVFKYNKSTSKCKVYIYAYPKELMWEMYQITPAPKPTKPADEPTTEVQKKKIANHNDLAKYVDSASVPDNVTVNIQETVLWDIVQIYCNSPDDFEDVKNVYLYIMDGLECTESKEDQIALFDEKIGYEEGSDYNFGGVYRVIFSAPNEIETFYRVDVYVKY